MVKKKIKLNPLGAAPSSLRKAREVTSQFHRITHAQEQLKAVSDLPATEKQKKLKELQQQLDDLGGRKAYQVFAFELFVICVAE
jgi:hypothetical protein